MAIDTCKLSHISESFSEKVMMTRNGGALVSIFYQGSTRPGISSNFELMRLKYKSRGIPPKYVIFNADTIILDKGRIISIALTFVFELDYSFVAWNVLQSQLSDLYSVSFNIDQKVWQRPLFRRLSDR